MKSLIDLLKTKFEEPGITFIARLARLGKTFILLPELWVFILVFALSWIPDGFKPIYMISDKPGEWLWLRGVFNGFFFAWTIAFISFVQKDESVTCHSISSNDDLWTYNTNKHWTMYVLAAVVWFIVAGLESKLTGRVTWWWLGVCAFLQITPWFMGDSLKEQAKHMGPAFTGVVLIIVSAWFLVVG